VSLKMTTTAEPIAGYNLTERIGRGGYGEVWKADAPGGLTKAVKLVFGQMQDQWASCELRSLRRIKEVRHPFLLSLERIEIVEGQLVIVTELADGSLKDRCEECRRSGLRGIPRDELLAHLSDAAEALDYMREKFSLQHLDVKPENLLMVGGRVKIGDFGLVSDIMDPQWNAKTPEKAHGAGEAKADGDAAVDGEAAAPVLGGLTPLYASPELFDGQPSIHSDQYSLAIVYQELLTGVLPFPGETTEQLAAQHRSGAARLTPLSSADRPIIARALSKDPRKRFASCRDLIAALRGPADAGLRQSPDEDLSHPPVQRHVDTAVAGSFAIPTEIGIAVPRAETMNPIADPALLDFDAVPEPMSVTDLPPFELTGTDRLRPTLWLGIGGTAAAILRNLRQRLHSRFGNLSELPALQMLLVDTDRETISQATQTNDAYALRDCDALLTPLRKSQEYREQSEQYLRWLSRRWLCNIPMSGHTEGFRPLGRLAFVDHMADITGRLRDALRLITAPESLAKTSKATGMEFRDPTPRVFLIASISGGTGSGMAFDMAHLVRRSLEHLGLPAQCLCGMFTHSTTCVPERKTLAIADAYAWLREWRYWQANKDSREMADSRPTVGGGNTPPLSQTYLVHLGDDIGDEEFEHAANDVAAYLDLDVATAGGEFFDKCRQYQDSQDPSQKPEARLRTLGICQTGLSQDEVADSTGAEAQSVQPLLIATCLDSAIPRLLAYGGSRRLLLAVPEGSVGPEARQYLSTDLGCAPTIITGRSDEVFFCYEGECLDVDRVAALIVGQRHDCASMAVRLHTRTDIAWVGQHHGY
jgi:eukaryotic-like serine/threonine-protein kinase